MQVKASQVQNKGISDHTQSTDILKKKIEKGRLQQSFTFFKIETETSEWDFPLEKNYH